MFIPKNDSKKCVDWSSPKVCEGMKNNHYSDSENFLIHHWLLMKK